MSAVAVCIKDCIQNMNLVIGCTIGCSYCYARNNVRRFHMIDDFEKPEFFPNKLRLMEKKRPQNFLLTGMSDFSHWRTEWREQIFAKMTENPQHQYLFLTKRPEDIVFSTTLENAWFGVTVTSSKEKNRFEIFSPFSRSCLNPLVFKTFRPFFPTIEKTASFYAPYIQVGCFGDFI